MTWFYRHGLVVGVQVQQAVDTAEIRGRLRDTTAHVLVVMEVE